MLARVTTSQGKPEMIVAGIRNFKENVGPTAKKMTGFKRSYLLVDRKNGMFKHVFRCSPSLLCRYAI